VQIEALLVGVIVLFFAVVISDWIAQALPITVPLPLIQIAMGGALSYGVGLETQTEPHLFFLLFLPPLLFLDGWPIPKDNLVKDLPVISGMATGLVLLSVVGIEWLIHQIFPAVALAVSFALAAILSPTDPVAVGAIAIAIAIAKKAPLPKRLLYILEGESLLERKVRLTASATAH
jgi:NhaP-type Na+/H+ or K+/H+ antiporter